MSPAEFVGFAAGTLGMVQAYPQVRRVRSLGHGLGVSLAMWVLTIVVNAVWCGYGIRTGSPSVTITNIVAAALSGSVVVQLTGSGARTWLQLTVFASVITALAMVLPMGIVSSILVALTASRVPQLLQSYRNFRAGMSSAVSLGSLTVAVLSLLGWSVFAVLESRGLMIITASIGLAINIGIVALELAARRGAPAILRT